MLYLLPLAQFLLHMSFLKNKYTRIGAMVVLASVAFVWGFNFLKGRDLLAKRNFYYALYSDVEGLLISDPILVKGYSVGTVNDIHLDVENPDQLLVRFYLTQDIHIPMGTKAELSSIDLFGSKGIRLKLGNKKGFYEPGDTIPSAAAKDMVQMLTEEVYPIKDQSTSILARADSLFAAAQFLLDTEMLVNMQKSMAHLEGITNKINLSLDRNTTLIDSIVAQVARTSEVLVLQREAIGNIVSNISDFTDTIAHSNLIHTINNLDTVVNNIKLLTDKLNTEDGTLNQLIEDRELYDNLVKATGTMDDLMTDIKDHPGKYVHLSLWNKSKNLFYDKDGLTERLAVEKDMEYLIVYQQTVAPIQPVPNEMSEFKYKDSFYYYKGRFTNVDAALNALDSTDKNKGAWIMALKKGKPTPLETIIN